MAIRLISGKPGSGKSFYCVNLVAKQFCKKIKKQYYVNEDIELITNIEGLTLDHIELTAAMGDLPFEQFFSNKNQILVHEEAKSRGKKIVYLIDECQEYFHKKFYNRDVFLFFEKHRHYEMDIILCAHTTKKVCGDIIDLIEVNIGAIPRSIQMGSFCYNHRVKSDIVKREFLKRRKEIFALYKSSSGKESMTIRSPVFRWLGLSLLGLGAGFYFFKVAFLDDAMASVDDKINTGNGLQVEGASPGHGKRFVRDPAHNKFRRIKNVIVCDKEVFIVDPETEDLTDVADIEYPVKLISKNGRVQVWGKFMSLAEVRSRTDKIVDRE